MKQNKYDEEIFFDKYSKMQRSINGLSAAGEWSTLKRLLPDFKNKDILDLGCGFGWHCKYASDFGANSIIGVDISKKMIEKAKEKNNAPNISYICEAIEDINFEDKTFDVVISSLTFHYIAEINNIFDKISKILKPQGKFIFSIEHPTFTANEKQNWCYNNQGEINHWPLDKYFYEGLRKTNFLDEDVYKYHRTLTTYINTLIAKNFKILAVTEPQPDNELIRTVPEMIEELRRPMMLIISTELS